MTNLVSRVLVAVAGLPVVLGIVWAGGWWLFGLAVVVAFVALTATQLAQRRGVFRLLYNAAVYTLSGAAASGAATLASSDEHVPGLFLAVLFASIGFYATNVVLIAAVVARAAGGAFAMLVRR